MQIGMIGLGRMGANMVLRLLRHNHECVVYDRNAENVQALVKQGAVGAASMEEFVARLTPPRTAWLMVPAAGVEGSVQDLAAAFQANDSIIDGGNSYYIDDIRRAKEMAARGINYLDVGTSGGVWGLERGYCLMIGGPAEAVQRLDPIFKALAPGRGDIPRTAGRAKAPGGTSEEGYLHCGPPGAGHFVKMVHNGIEYGVMAAYAEGLNVLHHANVGKKGVAIDAETTPLRGSRSITNTTSICPTSPKSGGAGAWSPPGCSISPPPRCSSSPASKASRAASRIPAKVAGPWRRRMTKAAPCRC